MQPSLRAARVATFVYFVLNGTVIGLWLVQIPAVEKHAGITHATLGSLLVLIGLGAFLGMQVAGRLCDRLGTRVVLPAAGILCSATLALPALPRDLWALGGALLVFGFGNGCLDVSMNAHAVHVEKAYDRPVMSAFHATFSVGGVIAALVAAGATGIGLSSAATLAAAAAVGVVIALVPARSLLASDPASPVTTDFAAAPVTVVAAEQAVEPVPVPVPVPVARRREAPARIWILAALALACMLCEGVANDWSALELKTVLGAPASTAAFAYGTYAATMTIGRLLADRISGHFGSAAVLRYGAATGAAGLTIVAFAPWIWLALLGWALFGFGLSGCVPQLFSAAGHTDLAAAGTNVSRVAGLGYLGMLAGPAIIGWMTHLVALGHAFLLPALLLVIASAAAGILRTGGRTVPGSEAETRSESESGSESESESASAMVRFS